MCLQNKLHFYQLQPWYFLCVQNFRLLFPLISDGFIFCLNVITTVYLFIRILNLKIHPFHNSIMWYGRSCVEKPVNLKKKKSIKIKFLSPWKYLAPVVWVKTCILKIRKNQKCFPFSGDPNFLALETLTNATANFGMFCRLNNYSCLTLQTTFSI